MERSTADIFWVLLAGGLVFLMQGGFLCLESGLTRTKNSINVALKNLSDFAVAAILFWLFGFALMFGASQGGWLGTTLFAPDLRANGPWLAAFFFFEVMFCATSATIVAGAVAERMRFTAYMFETAVISGLIYPLFGHWAWGGMYAGGRGWLAASGFVDFAGASVVHSVGGWVSLAALLIIGPRTGRFPADGPPQKINANSLPFSMLGVVLLFFGWFGFNGGSTLAADARVPGILINTFLGGSAGLVAGILLGYAFNRRPDAGMIINGSLAGLVAVTANCHATTAREAIVIGAIGAVIAAFVDRELQRRRIDDAVSAVAVHAGAGVWGTMAVALFGDPALLGTGLAWWDQLRVQALGVVVCFATSFGLATLCLRLINRVSPLRVTPHDEHQGLNVSEHDEKSELIVLLGAMEAQAQSGELKGRVPVEPFTEVGQIARQYNRVMEALEKAVGTYQGIFNHAVEGIFQIAPDGRCLSINPAMAAICGYASADELLQSVTDVRRQLFASADSWAEFSWQIERHGRIDNFEAQIRRKTGVLTWISTNAHLVRDEDGRVLYYEGMASDVTDRKAAEAQLALRTAELARSNSDLQQFAYVASHDLQEPLRIVSSYAQLFEDRYRAQVDAKGQKWITYMVDAAQRMQRLIEDLLVYSRVDTTSKTPSAVDPHECVQEALANLRLAIDRRGAEVTHEALPPVLADRRQLTQLFQNLVGNALKYCDDARPRVHIGGGRDGAHGRFSVRDNGIGIDPQFHERIFGVFQRLHERGRYEGTGIGLAICKKIVERHGGRIWVKSEPGKGATFHFTLPLAGQE
ncbi:MAG: ammonium transporter [Acidimicrobiia bacterium]|nr:ammonium transporter [Acidimicrobiia bacterium]